LLVLASLIHFSGCSAPESEGDGVDSEAQDLKKVTPKAGNGTFELAAPTFDVTGFESHFFFDRAPIAFGERKEKSPASYLLEAQVFGNYTGRDAQQQRDVTLTAGSSQSVRPGGMHIFFDRVPTLGSVTVIAQAQGVGRLLPDDSWATKAGGAAKLTLPGRFSFSSDAFGDWRDVTVVENAVTNFVLPTSAVSVTLDGYDPAFPNPAGCTPAFVRAGGPSAARTANVRNADGTPRGGFVVPGGERAPVTLDASGIEIAQSTMGGTNVFQLSRLEIEDVEVTKSSGGTLMVKGTVSVARKNDDGSFFKLSCVFPTHSGIDLPDGFYRITTVATGPNGMVTATNDVTFP